MTTLDRAVVERPILFSGPMVLALRAGRKTQTRRVVKGVTGYEGVVTGTVAQERGNLGKHCFINGDESEYRRCPYGIPGGRLWVRETFAFNVLKASGYKYRANVDPATDGWKWTPAIHMPRAACRLLLDVSSVRVERLQDISEADAKAEGAVFRDFGKNKWGNRLDGWSMEPENAPTHEHCLGSARFAFANLINKINGATTWDANPWVWVIEFKRTAESAMAIAA